MDTCPFCSGPVTCFNYKQKKWLECDECRFRFVHPESHPDPLKARERYLKHRNEPGNKGYRKWLVGIFEQGVFPYVHDNDLVVDYGCGPGNVPEQIFRELSSGRYRYRGYDLHFQPDNPGRAVGDVVLACEVVEHFTNPERDWESMCQILKPGGILAVSTLYAPVDREEFNCWWYKEDLTHLAFYTRRTLLKVGETLELDSIFDNGTNLYVYRKKK